MIVAKDFLIFEKVNDCFNKKIGNCFYWDLIRYDVFFSLKRGDLQIEKKNSRISFKVKFKLGLVFLFRLLFKSWDYVFFISSRDKLNSNKRFDRNLDDYINYFKEDFKDSIVIESFEFNKDMWSYKNMLYSPIAIFAFFLRPFYKKNDYSDIINIISKNFDGFVIDNNYINDVVINFKIEQYVYSIIFLIKKTKLLFIVRNGLQKGLISAAKKRFIPIVEVQHGIINEEHIAYNYNKDIYYNKGRLYLPTYFFTYSPFWNNSIFYPVDKEIIALGNNVILNKLSMTNNYKEGLLVSSSSVHGNDLSELILKFAREDKFYPIYFKLHPNQFSQESFYKEKFREYGNIKVFTNDKDIAELLEISKAVIVVESTTIYEALSAGRIGIIYKRQSYLAHKDIFDNGNVFLVDNSLELSQVLKNSFNDNYSKNIFFHSFKRNLFDKFMSELEL